MGNWRNWRRENREERMMEVILDKDLEWWHNKTVVFADDPVAKPYIVTASLCESENEIIFALMDLDYGSDNANWQTYCFSADEFKVFIARLWVVDSVRRPELWQALFKKRFIA